MKNCKISPILAILLVCLKKRFVCLSKAPQVVSWTASGKLGTIQKKISMAHAQEWSKRYVNCFYFCIYVYQGKYRVYYHLQEMRAMIVQNGMWEPVIFLVWATAFDFKIHQVTKLAIWETGKCNNKEKNNINS